MSVVNGTRLLAASPIKDMLHGKERHGGVTFGLAEVGYDVRIKQALHFTHDKYGNKITMVTTDGVSQRQIGWAVLVNVMEEFTMPPDLVGIGHPKSSWNRNHLRLGSPVAEPGWQGFLTISLDLRGEEELKVEAGSGIMQMIFYRLESDAAYAGRYQNQGDQIVGSIQA